MSGWQGFAFGDCILDLRRGALLRAGAEVPLRPKSFEVLRLLVEKHGVLVSKKELLDLVWGHTIVTEGSVTQCVIDVRRAIGDDAQRMVRTVPRRGYVFTAPVVETATEPDTPAEPAVVSASSAPASLPSSVSRILIAAATLMVTGIVEQRARRPSGEPLPVDAPDTGGSIAVLPFVDMSASGDQQFLSDGIAEEIIDRLAQAGGCMWSHARRRSHCATLSWTCLPSLRSCTSITCSRAAYADLETGSA